MTLQDISTTQETSRKLKEAGFPQEGLFYWVECFQMIEKETEKGVYEKKKIWLLEPTENINHSYHNYIRAFTFSELWYLLPKMLEKDLEMFWIDLYVSLQNPPVNVIGYTYLDSNEKGCHIEILVTIRKELLQEAAAELALWCVKEGYLNPKEEEWA